MLNPKAETFKKSIRLGLAKINDFYTGGTIEEHTSEMINVMTLFVVDHIAEEELKTMVSGGDA